MLSPVGAMIMRKEHVMKNKPSKVFLRHQKIIKHAKKELKQQLKRLDKILEK